MEFATVHTWVVEYIFLALELYGGLSLRDIDGVLSFVLLPHFDNLVGHVYGERPRGRSNLMRSREDPSCNSTNHHT